MQGYWTQFRVWYVKSNLCVAKLENANIQWNTHNLKNIKTLLHGTSLIYFPEIIYTCQLCILNSFLWHEYLVTNKILLNYSGQEFTVPQKMWIAKRIRLLTNGPHRSSSNIYLNSSFEVSTIRQRPLQFKIPMDLVDEMPVTDYRKQSTYCRRKPRKRAKRERKNISLTNSQHGEKTEEKENGRLSAIKKSCLLNLYEYTLKNQWNMNKKRVNLPGRVVRRLYISRNLEFSILHFYLLFVTMVVL